MEAMMPIAGSMVALFCWAIDHDTATVGARYDELGDGITLMALALAGLALLL